MNNIPENACNLTKREYLAAKFLQGLLSTADASFFCGGNSEQINHLFLSRAIELADKFLEYFDNVYVIEKKPKFKIGDKVYFVSMYGDRLVREICELSFLITDDQCKWEYYLAGHDTFVDESELLLKEDNDNE